MYTRLGGDAYEAVLPELQQDVERQAKDDSPNCSWTTTRSRCRRNRSSSRPARRHRRSSTMPPSADIDLIVVGTHGRGAVAHLLMGSVAERVVRTAHARC